MLTINAIWYIGGTLAILLVIAAVDYYLRHKHFPDCRICGGRLDEENTVLIDDDGNVCTDCYAKQIAPEYYYEDR
jgi:hypothetical protein